MRKVNIVIPVYGDWSSLRQNIISLKKHYSSQDWVSVYYVNDCGPKADILGKNINKLIKNLKNFYYFENDKNLGFVRNCNNAVFNIISKEGDVLLLNSDTKVTCGFLQEMMRVLHLEDNIGVVTSRSNNATVWSVPMNGRLANQPSRAYKYWQKIKKNIPEMYVTPTAMGFCMLIRRKVIDENGLFDEIYGKGYGEENDFTMKICKNSWTCATANYAFVFHYESKSFGSELHERLSKENHKILISRYPNYDNLVANYLQKIIEPDLTKESVLWRLFRKTYRVVEFGHFNGYKKMFDKIIEHIALKLFKRCDSLVECKDLEPKIKIWSHELSNTGAPLVLCDVLGQWSLDDKNTFNYIRLYCPQNRLIHETLINKLSNLGIKPNIDIASSKRFNHGDVVLLNSTAYDYWFFDDLLTNVENGTIRHVFWYIHEDSEKWVSVFWDFKHLIANSLEDMATIERYKNIKNRFREVIDNNKITIYVPSSNSVKNWQKYFNINKNFNIMPGRVMINKEDFTVKTEDDFNIINFVITGSVETRKGQLPVIYALESFYNIYYLKDPTMYRDFKLDIVGLNEVDENLADNYDIAVIHAINILKDKIKLHRRTSLEGTHEISKQSNLTITYSLAESFSMSTIEGMAFGHPIIRSEASGKKEQLKPGINGWAVNTNDWWGLVEIFEEVLNKKKTSNEKLASMSAESVKIARENFNRKYKIITDIDDFMAK